MSVSFAFTRRPTYLPPFSSSTRYPSSHALALRQHRERIPHDLAIDHLALLPGQHMPLHLLQSPGMISYFSMCSVSFART